MHPVMKQVASMLGHESVREISPEEQADSRRQATRRSRRRDAEHVASRKRSHIRMLSSIPWPDHMPDQHACQCVKYALAFPAETKTGQRHCSSYAP